MSEGGKDRLGTNHDIRFLKNRLFNYDSEKTCIKVQLLNKTGGASVYGQIVEASPTTDFAFGTGGADEAQPIGIIAESGVADGSLCWIVFSGICEVLLKDATASTHGYWVYTSDTAGRANATLAAPPGGGVVQLDQHMQEIGHCLESKTAGTNVLATIIAHFN